MNTSSLSKKSMVELSKVQSETCVSLLMSPASSGQDSRQSVVRFKNLVQDAEAALKHRNLREQEIQKLLKPGKKLLSDKPFWSHQTKGLAVYLEGGTIRLYQLPFFVQDRVVVGDRFHVRPLLKAVTQESFYILDLNLNGAQLLQCDENGISEFTPEGFPESLDAAMLPNGSETASHHQNGSRPEVHHREGIGVEENRKLAMEEWLRTLARSVEAFLRHENSPLVLAGVEYVVAEYRKYDRYPHTVEGIISGSSERKSSKELEKAAQQELKGHSKKRLADLIERYQSGLSQGRSASGLESCLGSAMAGTVEHLLVAEGLTHWGSFALATRQMKTLDQDHPEASELFEKACLDTLKNGGDVSLLPPRSVPNGSQVAAILRFPSA